MQEQVQTTSCTFLWYIIGVPVWYLPWDFPLEIVKGLWKGKLIKTLSRVPSSMNICSKLQFLASMISKEQYISIGGHSGSSYAPFTNWNYAIYLVIVFIHHKEFKPLHYIIHIHYICIHIESESQILSCMYVYSVYQAY